MEIDANAAHAAEVFGDSDGQRRAFFGIGRRPEFVEQHQRLRRGGARDEIDVGDMRRKRGEILLDGLVVADVGEHRVEYRQLGAVGRNRIPDCAISASSPTVFSATVFPPVFGPVMISCAAVALEFHA